MLKLKGAATADLIDSLLEVITPTAEALGVEPLVLPAGVDVELQTGHHALLERVCVALEEIAAQGRATEVSEAQIAPQALNARPSGDHLIGQAWTLDKGEKVRTGLNSRPPFAGIDTNFNPQLKDTL